MAVLRNFQIEPAYISARFTEQELGKVNQLVGSALTSRAMLNRLIVQRDEALQDEFQLAADTWQYLKSIRVASLEEFCQVIQQMQYDVRAS